jgi:pimeloyl-ACP methyl ester carboxylesterase
MIARTFLFLIVLSLSLPYAAQNIPPAGKREDKPPQKSGFVTANGIKLHYLDWGGSGDALLLLTGFGDNAHIFDSFAPKFTDRFHVIGLTRRGFGESDTPKTGYDTASRVEDIRQFLDAMKIEKASIAGHSMAGDELTLFASVYPKRVKRLVYLDAAYDRYHRTELILASPVISPLWKRLILEAIGSPQAAEVAIEDMKDMPPPEVWEVYKSNIKAMNEFHPDYTKVKAPALAFYAVSEHNPDVPPQADEETRRKADEYYREQRLPHQRESIKQFREGVRRGQVIEMKGAMHYLFLGKTQEEVVRRMREFLLQ